MMQSSLLNPPARFDGGERFPWKPIWVLYQELCPSYVADYRLEWARVQDTVRMKLERDLAEASAEHYRKSEEERNQRRQNEEDLNMWLQQSIIDEKQDINF